MNDEQKVEDALNSVAARLLNQQIWCWGQDILRPEGNWLTKIGFERVEPPADRSEFSSMYTLALPQERSIVLRGFGIFYGDQKRGGIFLPRFDFRPRYSLRPQLQCPPWSIDDVPRMKRPSKSQRRLCATLTLDLIEWIRAYEVTVAEELGTKYRQGTLSQWDAGEHAITPAEEMAHAWSLLSIEFSQNLSLL